MAEQREGWASDIDKTRGTHDAATESPVVRVGGVAYADPSVLPADVSANGDDAHLACSRKGETYVYPSRLSAGEDVALDVLKVEHRYSSYTATADGQVKASAGFLHAGTIMCTAVAGNQKVILYDNSAAAGTVLAEFYFAAAGQHSFVLDVPFGTALYCDFDGVTGRVTLSYR